MRRWNWLIVLGVIFWMGTATVSAESVPIATYWTTLEELEAKLDIPDQLTPLVEKLATWDEVALEDGRTIPIDHSFLVSQLKDDSLDVASKKGLVTTLLAIKKESVPLQQKLATDLEELLAQDEFNYEAKPLSWWERLLQRLLDLLERPFEEGSLPPWLGNNVLYFALVVLVLVVFYTTRGFWGQFVPQSAVSNEDHTEETLSADVASLRAQTISETGDYRSAVRYLYLSTLLRLDEHGVLRYDRAKTNREYLGLIEASPAAPILREVVDLFDRVWYGFESIGSAEYQHYARQVETLKETK